MYVTIETGHLAKLSVAMETCDGHIQRNVSFGAHILMKSLKCMEKLV